MEIEKNGIDVTRGFDEKQKCNDWFAWKSNENAEAFPS